MTIRKEEPSARELRPSGSQAGGERPAGPHDPTRDVPTYIARRPECGHLVACCVDDGGKVSRRDVAKFLAIESRAGLAIERVTVAFVRDSAATDWCTTTCRHSPHHSKRAKRRAPDQESLL
jgi:hypothetical protein